MHNDELLREISEEIEKGIAIFNKMKNLISPAPAPLPLPDMEKVERK